jgi:hypothetical protein
MGKPVVATKTKAMQMFENSVYLGDCKEDYINLIEKALVEDAEELIKKRIKVAQSHTWTNNVTAIYNAIQQATKNTIKWD